MTDPLDQDIFATYCLTARLDEGLIRAAVGELSADERRRHDQFLFSRDRRDFAVAHALLRRTLSARGNRPPHEWTFTSNAYGKPELAPGTEAHAHLSFNLAHTDGLVACVIARDAALGIDVERIDRRTDALGLARRFFAPIEIEALQRCAAPARQVRFTEIWTLKEAYVKAIGEGLSCPLHEFAFVFDGPSSLRLEADHRVQPSAWHFALFAPSDRHRMAVAVGARSAQKRRLVVRADAPPSGQAPETAVPCRVSISDSSV